MSVKLVLHLLLHSARLVEDELREELARAGLSHEQARYLDALFEHGPMTISALARGLHLSQPAATTMVRRLVAGRLVRRSTDPADARSSVVALTDRGATAVKAGRAVWLRAEARLLAGASRRESAHLHAALRKLLDRLGGRPPSFGRRALERH
jgi:DNA-binding MarR family transcriptional regulator